MKSRRVPISWVTRPLGMVWRYTFHLDSANQVPLHAMRGKVIFIDFGQPGASREYGYCPALMACNVASRTNYWW